MVDRAPAAKRDKDVVSLSLLSTGFTDRISCDLRIGPHKRIKKNKRIKNEIIVYVPDIYIKEFQYRQREVIIEIKDEITEQDVKKLGIICLSILSFLYLS